MNQSNELTIQQAAEIAGVSPSRIYQFIYQKRVKAHKEPPHKQRGIWYVDRESLEKFRANQFDPGDDNDSDNYR